MKIKEAADLLGFAKWIMYDMGMGYMAGESERYECFLRCGGANKEAAQAWANSLLPPGKRGRIRLVLNSKQDARAMAFIATVLRSIEDL